MFNFKSLVIIFKYDWHKIFETLGPKGNETLMEKKDHDNVVTGSILAVIGKVIFYALTFYVAKLITDGAIDVEKVYGFNIASTFESDILILGLPLFILACEFIIYKNSQKSYLHLGLAAFAFILLCYSLYLVLAWFYLIIKGHMLSFVGIIGAVVEIVGYLFIITGYLEFARKNKQKYIDDHREPEKESLIKTSVIGLDDIGLHAKKKCVKCGSDLESNYKFCIECGTKVE